MSGRPYTEELEAVERALVAVHNAEWDPIDGDPRNLDPEDEPLVEMVVATTKLLQAAAALDAVLRMEIRTRNHKLDEMSEAEYTAWEATVA